MSSDTKEIRLKGAPVCAGIAIGKPFLYRLTDSEVPRYSLSCERIEGEISRYRTALDESRGEIDYLRAQLETEGAIEGAAILEAHLHILKDPSLTSFIEERIASTQRNAEAVFHEAISDYERRFEELKDPYLRERVKDLQDIARRVLGQLRSAHPPRLSAVPERSIIFAHELSPSEAAEADEERISAFVTQVGGETCHAAIMAKARGIPYVANVDFDQVRDIEVLEVIVDGRIGEVILNPGPATRSKYIELQKQQSLYFKRLREAGRFPAETVDGLAVSLFANVEMFNEIPIIRTYGGSGIGLFRSEYLCVAKQTFPSEDEQFRVYKRLAEEMRGNPVVIRTFDVGGDKFQELIGGPLEDNPFLGCRAIRYMLREQASFRIQLRAILKASVHGEIGILFPMISGLSELREAKEILEDVKAELRLEGIAFDERIKVGCMIEVPSAAITCDLIAPECDFLSIGTNDLIQYSLAVDRGNPELHYLYTPAHPSVLRLIKMVVTEGNRHNIPVTLCGEVAADPRFTPLLLGLGISRFSVATRYLPVVLDAIRRTNIVNASALAQRVLTMATPAEVLDTLIAEYQESVSADFFPNAVEESHPCETLIKGC